MWAAIGEKKKIIYVAILIAVLALAVRVPGLGDFMTVDEERWMIRSGQFWHELFRNGNPGGTFATTHPGATTMWVAGAGIAWQEARLGYDIDTANIRNFRAAALWPMAISLSLLIGLAGWLLARLTNWKVAAGAGLLLAVEPYLVGMSQVVHVDMLLALFMLIATLSWLLGVKSGQRWQLILAGVMAGLAMATKFLPAVWLPVFFGLYLLGVNWRGWRRNFGEMVRVWWFVIGLAVLTAYIVWPVLWIKDDFFRSFERDAASVVTDAHVEIEVSEEPILPASFYVRTLGGRATPFVQILAFGALLAGIRYVKKYKEWPTILWLIVYVIGFLVMITLAAKKADRYALPALVMLPVIAGWIFVVGFEAFNTRVQPTLKLRLASLPRLTRLAVALVVLLLIAQVWIWVPYTIAYNNPYFDVRPLSQQGWGEGLDAAAKWLNKHPLVEEDLMIASWYPGVMRTFFEGRTMSLSSRDDHRVGYVVLYRNMGGRAVDEVATNIWDEFKGREPEQIFYIGGDPYVWVFNTLQPQHFSQHVGELVGGMEVGQTVPIDFDGWDKIDIALANFSGRANTEDVILHIKSNINSDNDLRSVTIRASEVEDETWHEFKFEQIENSAGQTYFVSLTSENSVAGNAITVKIIEKDILPGELMLRRRPFEAGEIYTDFLREGDLAYRLRR